MASTVPAGCDHSSQRPNRKPISSAHKAPSSIHGASASDCAATAGVKYSPSTVPTIHCPPLRNRREDSSGAPAIDSAAVDSSGPIIQGSGVFRWTQAWAASQATSSVASRRRGRGVSGFSGRSSGPLCPRV